MQRWPCLWNGIQRPCYLFARKFHPESLNNLLHLFSNYTTIWAPFFDSLFFGWMVFDPFTSSCSSVADEVVNCQIIEARLFPNHSSWVQGRLAEQLGLTRVKLEANKLVLLLRGWYGDMVSLWTLNFALSLIFLVQKFFLGNPFTCALWLILYKMKSELWSGKYKIQ